MPDTHRTDQASLDSSDDEYAYSIREAEKVFLIDKSPLTSVNLNTKPCKMMIDTGATVNILDQKTYLSIGSPKLK